jgi:hypothetical protein
MKKTLIFLGAGTFALMMGAMPAVSSAAMYHYIDLSGRVGTVEANSPQQALALANSFNNVLHSGVKLDQGMLQTGESYGFPYRYVDIYGNTRTVTAASLDAAYMLATDRASNSGINLAF